MLRKPCKNKAFEALRLQKPYNPFYFIGFAMRIIELHEDSEVFELHGIQTHCFCMVFLISGAKNGIKPFVFCNDMPFFLRFFSFF